MSTSRKLEDAVSNLEDMSVTLEEIKDKVTSDANATEKLDKVQSDMTRVADLVEDSLEESAPGTPVITAREGSEN